MPPLSHHQNWDSHQSSSSLGPSPTDCDRSSDERPGKVAQAYETLSGVYVSLGASSPYPRSCRFDRREKSCALHHCCHVTGDRDSELRAQRESTRTTRFLTTLPMTHACSGVLSNKQISHCVRDDIILVPTTYSCHLPCTRRARAVEILETTKRRTSCSVKGAADDQQRTD